LNVNYKNWNCQTRSLTVARLIIFSNF